MRHHFPKLSKLKTLLKHSCPEATHDAARDLDAIDGASDAGPGAGAGAGHSPPLWRIFAHQVPTQGYYQN